MRLMYHLNAYNSAVILTYLSELEDSCDLDILPLEYYVKFTSITSLFHELTVSFDLISWSESEIIDQELVWLNDLSNLLVWKWNYRSGTGMT